MGRIAPSLPGSFHVPDVHVFFGSVTRAFRAITDEPQLLVIRSDERVCVGILARERCYDRGRPTPISQMRFDNGPVIERRRALDEIYSFPIWSEREMALSVSSRDGSWREELWL